MRYLLTYPYGCVEQTSSGVLALAALRGVVQDDQVPGLSLEEVDKYLSRGVQRILSMQTDNGGFSYWPGQSETHGWGSIYAGSALSLAKKNGLEVPEEPLDKALDYFHEQIKNPKTPDRGQGLCRLYPGPEPGPWIGTNSRGLQPDYARLNREGKLLLLLAAREANLRPPAELQKDLKPLLGPDNAKETRWGWDEFNALARGPALALLAAKAIMPEDPLPNRRPCCSWAAWTSKASGPPPAAPAGPCWPWGNISRAKNSAPSPERSPSASPAPPPSSSLNSIPRASERLASIPSFS